MPLRLLLIIGFAVLCVALLTAFAFLVVNEPKEKAYIEIQTPETKTFSIEVVATEQMRVRGLSSRTEVPPDYGMLFIFDKPGRYGFWMKDMQVAIDILWLSDDGTIVGIEESVAPETYPTVFYSPEYVRHVLETRAGEAKAQGWQVGSHIDMPPGVL